MAGSQDCVKGDGCEDCIKTIETDRGEISVDLCKMVGTCTCNHEKMH